jgi:hypothetical protein
MLITEQSLAETLEGRASDPRRRCRLFIPDQAVFIRDQLLFSQCSVPGNRMAAMTPLSGCWCEGDHGRAELEARRCRSAPAPAHIGHRHHRRHG